MCNDAPNLFAEPRRAAERGHRASGRQARAPPRGAAKRRDHNRFALPRRPVLGKVAMTSSDVLPIFASETSMRRSLLLIAFLLASFVVLPIGAQPPVVKTTEVKKETKTETKSAAPAMPK